MKLLTLLKDLPQYQLTGSDQIRIAHLESDSRAVQPGTCFVAQKGAKIDSHEFIPEAIRRGARAIVAECPKPADVSDDVSWVEVNDARLALSLLSSAWYRHPSRKLCMIGVTGTNGKTTTTYIIHALLRHFWMRAGLIGTIAYDNGKDITTAVNTTPGPLVLGKLLREMLDNGCRAAAMEVSSHALDQERTAGIEYNIGVFTNLTQDHLDYHRNMENYFQAKVKLFEQMAREAEAGKKRKKPVAVINVDDPYGRRLAEMFASRLNVKTYGASLGANFRINLHHVVAKGSEYELTYKGKSYLVRIPLIGKFNIYNSLAALVAVVSAGITLRDAISALKNIHQVPGRLELISHPAGARIFVDYAHTPDALENVCTTLKELSPKRLITVFGCGGDRDRSKRPQMGAIAARLSDACIVTSDNPRSEDPVEIIAQITAGMPSGSYAVIPDRARAIASAIEQARLGDIILIAGKGHESYQETESGRTNFSDVGEIKRSINEFYSAERQEPKAPLS